VDDQPFGDADTMEGAKNRAKAAYRAYRDSNNGVKPHLAIAMEGGLEWIAVHRTGDASATSNNNNNHTKNQQDDSPEKDDTGHCAQSNLNHTSQGDNDSPQNALFCMAWIAVYGKRNGTVLEMLCSDCVAHYTGDRAPVFGLSRTASFALPPEITKLVITQQMELGDADNHVFQRSHDESKRGQGTVGILTDGLIDRPSYYEHAILLALTMWIRPDVYPTGFR
jgi:non-canonical (house-cleaning) NTP pyrophosphatase